MSGPIFWFLRLNDMRSSKIEYSEVVCWAETEQELADLLEREKVEGYDDGKWGKSFRQGGPLEWYNQPFDGMGQGVFPLEDPRNEIPNIHSLGDS